MFILIPIIISILAALAIWVSPVWSVTGRNRDLNIKRTLIFLGATVVLSSLISLFMWGFGTMKTMDKEVWNLRAVSVKYEERWTTEESKTVHTTHTDSKGKSHTTSKTVYYTKSHGPYWTVEDENGNERRTDEETYIYWSTKVWKNTHKTGEHRGSSHGWDRAITGGIFEAKWDNKFDTSFPLSDIHRYENKVRYSHSVLKFKEPTKAILKQYPRPADKNNTSPAISYGGHNFTAAEIELLRRTNAELGPRCLLHTILITFSNGVPRDVVDDVLSAWKGPNKNELVTFMALDGDKISWVEVHSWMDDTTLHGVLRDELMGKPFNVRMYSDLLRTHCPKMWVKKNFHDFDYLRVEIAWGWKLGAFLMSLAVVVGSFFVIDANVVDRYTFGSRSRL